MCYYESIGGVFFLKKVINVVVEWDGFWFDFDIVYVQVFGWLGNVICNLWLLVICYFVIGDDIKFLVIFWFVGGGWMDIDYNIYLLNLVDFVWVGYLVVGVEYCDFNKVNFLG